MIISRFSSFVIVSHPSVVLSSEEEEEEEGEDDGDGREFQSSGWVEESGNSELIQVRDTPESLFRPGITHFTCKKARLVFLFVQMC